MATGWEKGVDGKWRYEMPDAKIKDTIDVGGGNIVKRFEEDMLWTDGKLEDAVDAPKLFEAYPQLKNIKIHTDAVMNDMPSNGEYNPQTKTITIHADELKYLNSILNHEIQHVIQHEEGLRMVAHPNRWREISMLLRLNGRHVPMPLNWKKKPRKWVVSTTNLR